MGKLERISAIEGETMLEALLRFKVANLPGIFYITFVLELSFYYYYYLFFLKKGESEDSNLYIIIEGEALSTVERDNGHRFQNTNWEHYAVIFFYFKLIRFKNFFIEK